MLQTTAVTKTAMNAIQNFFVMAFSELWGGYVSCVEWDGGCVLKNPAKVNSFGVSDRFFGGFSTRGRD